MKKNIINCKKIAKNIYNEIKTEIKELKIKPTIVAILVWNNESSKTYIKQKEKWAKYTNIKFILKHFKEKISEKELLKEIIKLNNDKNVNGYIVQLPLPKHINDKNIIKNISQLKDIDGFHPINQWHTVIWSNPIFTPCTPKWIMEIFKEKKINLKWKIITVIGRSNIVWKPLINLLINKWATIIACNCDTNQEYMKKRTKESDIVIVATWVTNLLKADMINKKTIVIDVWITKKEDWKLYWDADFENIVKKWNLITPVPWWVWQLTVAMLIKNVLKAYKMQNTK